MKKVYKYNACVWDWCIGFFYLYLNISKGPPIQLPGRAQPPTSFGTLSGAPSAPNAQSYPPMGFPNAPPTSFGMPQPYSQAATPYPTQPIHPTSDNTSMHTNVYPPQQMPYPSQSMPTPCYSFNANSSQPAPSPYPQQQNYNMYPNLQKAPDARECYNNIAPSSYFSGPNAHATNSIPYQGANYPRGQGVGSTYSYTANPPTTAPRGATPAPRRERFTPKVILKIIYMHKTFEKDKSVIFNIFLSKCY